ncbi:hypothetical protein NL442_25095, partial [Klebsiella pneumoniae]|nr:hypothetical protein [Klebsiella pneumoniae]
KRAYCLKTQPATGETYPKSDLFNKAFYFLNLNHENSFVIVNEKKSYPFFNMSGPNIIGDIIL